jgi:hypothetical protein
MSTIMSSFKRSAGDHFEPEGSTDPQAQRRLRGQLEQIDYTAFASNQAVLGQMLGHIDVAQIQKLAVAAAQARFPRGPPSYPPPRLANWKACARLSTS